MSVKVTLLTIWAAAIALGMAGLIRYQTAPGSVAENLSARWPDAASIKRDPVCPTLVMFLHPKCPCSVATIHELANLTAHATQPMAVDVFFVDPSRAPGNWAVGELWRGAGAIPGVHVGIDVDGKLAAAFGATTSGDVSLYSAAGDLLFKGGITDGRGHEGDNPGLTAILDIVGGREPAVRRTSVFGCPLSD